MHNQLNLDEVAPDPRKRPGEAVKRPGGNNSPALAHIGAGAHAQSSRAAGNRVSVESLSGPIVFFHRGDVWGGAEESLVTIARDFSARGAKVHILCVDASQVADRYEAAGFKVDRAWLPKSVPRDGRSLGRKIRESLECRAKNWPSAVGRRIANFAVRQELVATRRALMRVSPAVFFGNMSAGNDYQFLSLASQLGFGTVSLQQISPPVWVGRGMSQDVSRFCDHFVSNSIWTRKLWIERGLRSEDHDVIYYVIEAGNPAQDGLREKLGISPSTRVIASVGRLSAEKQFDIGIRAFAALPKEFKDWQYVILGEGGDRERLEDVIRHCGLGDRVHLAGEVRNAWSYLGQVDLLLHPTRGEHFGRVVAEAMLKSTMVVGHNSGGVPEMVLDDENGFLFEEEKSLPGRLADAMRQSRNEPMRAKARQHVTHLCGTNNAEKLARLVASIAEAARKIDRKSPASPLHSG